MVVGNDIRWGRDGIFVNTSKRNVFRGNRFRDLRFAVHYMYVHDSEVSENVSLGNHLGYAIMFSDRVVIRDNLSDGDRDYGIMLNYANRGRVTGNLVRGTGDRCVFIYNAHKNELSGNRFERCGIGVHFTAGSERNRIVANAFVGNRTQVKYVGSRWLDWGPRAAAITGRIMRPTTWTATAWPMPSTGRTTPSTGCCGASRRRACYSARRRCSSSAGRCRAFRVCCREASSTGAR